jgi:hypothetical protein
MIAWKARKSASWPLSVPEIDYFAGGGGYPSGGVGADAWNRLPQA